MYNNKRIVNQETQQTKHIAQKPKIIFIKVFNEDNNFKTSKVIKIIT